jgi:hypothetical protein
MIQKIVAFFRNCISTRRKDTSVEDKQMVEEQKVEFREALWRAVQPLTNLVLRDLPRHKFESAETRYHGVFLRFVSTTKGKPLEVTIYFHHDCSEFRDSEIYQSLSKVSPATLGPK